MNYKGKDATVRWLRQNTTTQKCQVPFSALLQSTSMAKWFKPIAVFQILRSLILIAAVFLNTNETQVIKSNKQQHFVVVIYKYMHMYFLKMNESLCLLSLTSSAVQFSCEWVCPLGKKISEPPTKLLLCCRKETHLFIGLCWVAGGQAWLPKTDKLQL